MIHFSFSVRWGQENRAAWKAPKTELTAHEILAPSRVRGVERIRRHPRRESERGRGQREEGVFTLRR